MRICGSLFIAFVSRSVSVVEYDGCVAVVDKNPLGDN